MVVHHTGGLVRGGCAGDKLSVSKCRSMKLGDWMPAIVNGLECYTKAFELDSVSTGDPMEWNPRVWD